MWSWLRGREHTDIDARLSGVLKRRLTGFPSHAKERPQCRFVDGCA
jgi:hypothetical protein